MVNVSNECSSRPYNCKLQAIYLPLEGGDDPLDSQSRGGTTVSKNVSVQLRMDTAIKNASTLLQRVLKELVVAPYVYLRTFLSRVNPFGTKIDVRVRGRVKLGLSLYFF